MSETELPRHTVDLLAAWHDSIGTTVSSTVFQCNEAKKSEGFIKIHKG